MAKIGLKNFKFGVLSEASDGTPTYGTGVKPAKAISCSVSITSNSAMLYADDALAESDTTFQSGTGSLGIDDEDLSVMATLLGHTYTSDTITRSADDIAPYVGLGRIVTKIVNGSYKYKVEFIYKVKFSEPSQDDNTKGESVEFGTSTLEGVISCLANGKWSEAKTFDSLSSAQTYLDGKFGTASV